MRRSRKSMSRLIIVGMLVIGATGCNRTFADGLRGGLEQGLVVGVSTAIATLFGALTGSVFEMEPMAG